MAERPDAKLYAALTAGASPVEAVVGDRIYPVRVPANVSSPCIAYKRVESATDHTLDSNVPSWIAVRYEVWCVANKHSDAEALGDLIEQLNAAGIRVVDRISEKGPNEDSPYASIVTVDVTVL